MVGNFVVIGAVVIIDDVGTVVFGVAVVVFVTAEFVFTAVRKRKT